MSLPAEPRQKMINIMYLVLTALLALNVSVQILRAFVAVDKGLTQTNRNYDIKNISNMAAFDKQMTINRVKTKPFYDKAMDVQKWSKELCDYMDTLKATIKMAGDGLQKKVADTMKIENLKNMDNFDIPTTILLNESAAEDYSKGKAHELKVKMRDYRKKIMAFVSPLSDTAFLNIGLKTPDNPHSYEFGGARVPWEADIFYDRPIVANICLLSQLQNEVKNAQASMIQYLLASINTADFKFDKLQAAYIPQSNYVLLGDSFKSQIFVSAFNSTQNPRILVGDIDTLSGKVLGRDTVSVKVSSGVGHYAVKTDHEGVVKYSGVINIKDPTGNVKSYPFHSSYLVAKPAVVISPTQMNVFYVGVDNPVEISAPGFASEDIRPSLQGSGSITGGKGKYIVRVTGQNNSTCHISVSAKSSEGNSRSFPPQEFRIKTVPDPICYVANQKGDMFVSKTQLGICTEVQARMDNFDFKLSYDVTSFEMVVTVAGLSKKYSATSAKFTPEMKSIMKQVTPGSHVIIQNVHVQGPPGSKKISGVNITVS